MTYNPRPRTRSLHCGTSLASCSCGNFSLNHNRVISNKPLFIFSNISLKQITTLKSKMDLNFFLHAFHLYLFGAKDQPWDLIYALKNIDCGHFPPQLPGCSGARAADVTCLGPARLSAEGKIILAKYRGYRSAELGGARLASLSTAHLDIWEWVLIFSRSNYYITSKNLSAIMALNNPTIVDNVYSKY